MSSFGSHTMEKPLLMTFSDEEASTALDSNDGTINPNTEYVVGPLSVTPDHKKSPKSDRRAWKSWNIRNSKKQGRQQTPRTQRVTLYSKRENGQAQIEVLDVPDRRTSTVSDDEFGNSEGGIIEGNFTASFIDSGTDYDNLTGLGTFGWDEPSTTLALDFCKKYVLNPYHIFLKVIYGCLLIVVTQIGWRSFRSPYDRVPLHKRLCNILYPVFVFFMLIFACASQISTCFSRSRSHPPQTIGNFSVLLCDDHIFTREIIDYILILSAYLGGLFLFRFIETEHLSSLSETVFLSYNYTTLNKSRKKPAFILLGFLVSGICWFLFSFATSILRIFAFRLDKSTTIIHWFTDNTTSPDQCDHLRISFETYKGLHYSLVSFSMFGFIFFDLLYIAVVINYASQCQLLTFYIENIKDKVLNKQYKTLSSALKEIYHVYEFLKVLNGKLAFVTTMILFIFGSNIITSYWDLSDEYGNDTRSVVLGFFNIIQWIAAFIFPVFMATILTSKGKGLRNLGLQVGCRPYVYSDTPDLELNMFLNYVQSTKFAAKISLVPMYPSLVCGGIFILFLLVTLNILIPPVSAVNWF